jgi:acetyl esterase
MKMGLIFLLVALLAPLRGQDAETGKSKLPPADHANVNYGPTPLNVMDVWLAKSDRPTPVLIYFHGGGFVAGSKENLPAPLLAAALRAGISVIAVNYRLAPGVVFPTHYLDCARSIQFARHSAAAWNLDPHRVALTGSSAGGASSLWIAFHPDLADPKSADPVAWESTRVTCAAVSVAQPSYDPRLIRQLVGEAAARHPVFRNLYGLKADELDTEKAYRLYAAAAPVTYLAPDSPPVWAAFGGSRDPVPAGAKAGEGIHHPNLGIYLKQRMDEVKVECVLRLKGAPGNATDDEVNFLKNHFGQ